jgi:DNA polymerase
MLRDADRKAILERLAWLRLMGVSEIGMASPTGKAVPAAAGPASLQRPPAQEAPPARMTAPLAPAGRGTRPAPADIAQQGLFGEIVAVEAARPPGRARGATPGPASPLAGRPWPEGTPPEEALRQVREEIGDCRRCRLCEKRTQIVFGVGSPQSRLMFVGEGPGADEDAQGEPFVGRAGQLLTRIIEGMGLRRQDVYIANVVKCRPPDNRTPLPDEVATCSPFLFRQIQAIRPRVIVCLGTPAAQAILGTRETITRLRDSR